MKQMLGVLLLVGISYVLALCYKAERRQWK